MADNNTNKLPLFGNGAANNAPSSSATSQPNTFATTSSASSSSNIFGNANNTTTSGAGTGFTFPSSANPTSTAGTSNVFGNATNTPAANKVFGANFNTTTPQGEPAKSNLFGASKLPGSLQFGGGDKSGTEQNKSGVLSFGGFGGTTENKPSTTTSFGGFGTAAPTSKLTFGSGTTTDTSKLFGTGATTSAPSLGGLGTGTATSAAPNFFGTGVATPSSPAPTKLFGEGSKPPSTSSSTNIFGGAANQQPSTTSDNKSGDAMAPLGATFFQPSKKPGTIGGSTGPISAADAQNLMTQPTDASASAGGASQNASAPSSNKPGSMFTLGQPPAPAPGQGGLLFQNLGQNKPATTTSAASSSNMFGTAGQQHSSTPAATPAPAGSTLFPGLGQQNTTSPSAQPTSNLFQNLGQKNTAATSAPASGSTLFPSAGQQNNATPSVQPSSTLFPSAGQQNTATSSAQPSSTLFPSSGQQNTTAPAPGLGNLFGNKAPTSSAAPSTMFPNAGNNAAGANTTSAPSTSNLFQNLGNTAAANTSAATPATTAAAGATPSANLFGPKAPGATTSQPSASTAAPAAGLGGGIGGGLGGGAPQPNPDLLAGGGIGLGANAAAGAAKNDTSRLAHKSLDDILTTWSTSLTQHQKSFQELAKRVSAWDRQLVENSLKIGSLYGRCFQAERDCSEVERQLTNVEHSQQEIEQFLNKYEEEVDRLLADKNLGEESIGGVDAERERTYKAAEKAAARLNSLEGSLTDMVEEINATSTKLVSNKGAKNNEQADADPLHQIVRMLNGHLSQLQDIGTGAKDLQDRVAVAQREARVLSNGQSLNGGNDWVQSFGRSYLGRR